MQLHNNLAGHTKNAYRLAVGQFGQSIQKPARRLPQLGNLGVCFLIAQIAQSLRRGDIGALGDLGNLGNAF